MSRISKELKEFKKILDLDEQEYLQEEDLEKYDLHLLIKSLEEEAFYIKDKRDFSYVIHSLEEILITTILALMANCNNFVEIHIFAESHYEWLKKYLAFTDGLPSLSTFKRIISIINPKELEEICNEVFFKFIKSYNNDLIYKDTNIEIKDINSLDGKTANSSKRTTRDGKIPKTNAMSAYSVKYDKCLATEFISDKTNEIPIAPILLSRLNIKNVIVTFDALNTQKETIKYIANNKGYYVAPIKENQKLLHENINNYFMDKTLIKSIKNKYIEEEKSHNRYEKRTYFFTNDIDWLYKKSDWEDIKSIGVVIKEINNIVVEVRYFISNLDSNYVKLIAKVIRNEWSIENKLHWYLDMCFQEDKNKCYLENSQKNLNIIRKFCLAVLKIVKDKYKLSMNSLRLKLSINFEKELEKMFNNL